MRGIRVVVCGFVLASVIVSLAALSAGAQTAPQERPAGSSAYDGPSQGSFTEGRAGPDEPSLVDDTPPTAAELEEPLATARGGASGNDVVRAAKRHIGTRYRYATCTASRMSCTCLTKSAWGRFGHRLPMDEYGQWRYEPSKRIRYNDLRRGDIVFFAEGGGGLTHVGIYSGRGNLVHASKYFGKVVESKMRYIRGYSGAIRLNPR